MVLVLHYLPMCIIKYIYQGKPLKAKLSIKRLGGILTYKITFKNQQVINDIGYDLSYILNRGLMRPATLRTDSNGFLLDFFHDEVIMFIGRQ
ncbi:MAG: hypothetical protein JWN76_1170 [Chitinophagaceae bacterium]|nr:hypothetical protein [Chitinophagaceae bacterium]